MSQRELVVLGTASQVPTRYRNHNGYLLRWDGEGFLFDPGEGTQRQMLFAGVAMRQVSRVCITHFHGDHCLGLPGVVQRLSLDGAPHPVPVYFPGTGAQYYERLRHASIFEDRAEVFPQPITTGGTLATESGWWLSALPLEHSVDVFGYRLQERPSRQVDPERARGLGVAGPAISTAMREGSVSIEGRRVSAEAISRPRVAQSAAFIMDTRLCDNAFELARDVDLLIIEATFLQADAALARRYGHLTCQEAATIARDAGARRLVLTHFSQRYQDIDNAFAEEAGALFDDVVVARDGLRVAVPARRRLAG